MFPCIFEVAQTVAFIILSAFQQNEAFSLSCGIVALETVFVKRDTQHPRDLLLITKNILKDYYGDEDGDDLYKGDAWWRMCVCVSQKYLTFLHVSHKNE